MRGKRAKQYRKLMQQYGLSFGFREPYQVLIDADMIKDADRFKMDLIGGLERTLQGKVKPMITQCSMRHLYASSSDPGISFLIDKAKLFERRRCNHIPEEYPEPLSTHDCITSVVDPKGSKTNKHRYVVASQDLETRKELRGVQGVPLVYVNKSVMIMEPMADKSVGLRESGERAKFRDGLRKGENAGKRKREDDGGDGEEKKKKKVRGKGPKEPNPLSVKKSKKKTEGEGVVSASEKESKLSGSNKGGEDQAAAEGSSEAAAKKKRRRKHKPAAGKEGEVVAENQDGDDGSD